MSHLFTPDDNGFGCDLCPLPRNHPTHDTPPARVLPTPVGPPVVTPAQAATSVEAAHRAWPHVNTHRWWILMALDATDVGNTDEDLAAVLEVGLNTIRPRRGELVAAGWVEPLCDRDGVLVTRPTSTGAQAQVWCLTADAAWRLGREAAHVG